MERILVVSRTGHFNFCNPSQNSTSTHIAIVDGDTKIKYCNITTDDEITVNSPLEIIDLINDNLKRWISSSHNEIKELRDYIEKNIDKLEYGNALWDLEALKQKRNKIEEKITKLEKQIDSFKEVSYEKK